MALFKVIHLLAFLESVYAYSTCHFIHLIIFIKIKCCCIYTILYTILILLIIFNGFFNPYANITSHLGDPTPIFRIPNRILGSVILALYGYFAPNVYSIPSKLMSSQVSSNTSLLFGLPFFAKLLVLFD